MSTAAVVVVAVCAFLQLLCTLAVVHYNRRTMAALARAEAARARAEAAQARAEAAQARLQHLWEGKR